MSRKRPRALRPFVDRLDGRCLLSGLTPAQVTQAYGLSGLSFTNIGHPGNFKGDGSGVTIAIIVAYHDPYLPQDLNTFDAAFHLPSTANTLAQANLAGNRTDSGWAGEATLDVEWAHAVAPAARILVVEAASDTTTDILAAINVAKSFPDVQVVSMSWGLAESADLTALDGYFTTPPGHQGITYLAATGDAGPTAGAQWPSTSPGVIGVGGTTLRVSSTGTYRSEATWSGGGGGYSQYQPEPWYQYNLQWTGVRSTPDVAFVADPNTGGYVYTTDPSTGQGSWTQVGGTSLGTPAWAGIIALVDQGLEYSGRPALSSGQALDALYSLPSSDFHAVAASSSGNGLSTDGATASSVTTTGLGTPNGSSLIRDLVSGRAAPAARSAATTAGGAAAGGTGVRRASVAPDAPPIADPPASGWLPIVRDPGAAPGGTSSRSSGPTEGRSPALRTTSGTRRPIRPAATTPAVAAIDAVLGEWDSGGLGLA